MPDAECVSVDEAYRRYLDEWLVFSEPRFEGQHLLDGVIYFHGRDQELAYEKAAEVRATGSVAIHYAGEPIWKRVTFESIDAVR